MADQRTKQELAASSPDATEPTALDAPTPPLREEEVAARHAVWWQERRERSEALVNDSRRSWAAMQGWDAVQTQADWDATMDKTVEEWHSGELFITMLGGQRYLDPPHTALMFHLWHHFVGTYRPAGPAEYLAIAMALFAFHHLVRVNEFAGNMATRLEYQFFDTTPPQVRIVDREGHSAQNGRSVQIEGREALEQFGREALPLMDRLNRMVIRNLKALRDLKTMPLALNVQNYGQLNVGQLQTNVNEPTAPQRTAADAPDTSRRPSKRRPKTRQAQS